MTSMLSTCQEKVGMNAKLVSESTDHIHMAMRSHRRATTQYTERHVLVWAQCEVSTLASAARSALQGSGIRPRVTGSDTPATKSQNTVTDSVSEDDSIPSSLQEESVTAACLSSAWDASTRNRSEKRMTPPAQSLILVCLYSGENRRPPSPQTRARQVTPKWVLSSARRRNRGASRCQLSLIGGLVTRYV